VEDVDGPLSVQPVPITLIGQPVEHFEGLPVEVEYTVQAEALDLGAVQVLDFASCYLALGTGGQLLQEVCGLTRNG
jgi:hypothetical protein